MNLKTNNISLTINDEPHHHSIESRVNLADFLRHECNLTGTHVGCEHGVCGACSVLVNSKPVRSCLMLAVQANGSNVKTVEGLAMDGKLSALQESFWAEHGLQCGFCTSGILISLTDLLQRNSNPNEAEIRDVLSGHLCRCTGYQNIVHACLKVVSDINGQQLKQ